MDTAQCDVANLTQELDSLREETTDLVRQLQEERESGRTEVTSLMQQLDSLREETTDLAHQLQEERDSGRTEVTSLTQQVDSLREETTDLVRQLQEERESGRTEVTSLTQQLDSLREETTDLARQLQEERERARRKLSRWKRKHDKLITEHRLSIYVLEKNLGKVRDFIRRTNQNLRQAGSSASVGGDATPQGPQHGQGATTPAASITLEDVKDESVLHPKSLSKIKAFYPRQGGATLPQVWALAYLPNGLIVCTDNADRSLKVYSSQGRHFWTKTWNPCSGVAALSKNKVAATSAHKVQIIKVTRNEFKVKACLSTPRSYHALAAVGPLHLAAAHGLLPHEHGVDLVDMEGQVIRTISSDMHVDSLCFVPDDGLVGCYYNNLSRIAMSSRNVLFSKQVTRSSSVAAAASQPPDQPETVQLSGVSADRSGHLLVCDRQARVVYLVSGDGQVMRDLWRLPAGECAWQGEELLCVSVMRDQCVCATNAGRLFVFDIVY